MNTSPFERIEALFHEALAMSADQRAAFLDRVCEGDAATRREIERLLLADAATHGLDAPSSARPRLIDAAQDPFAKPGAQVGAFRLQRILGAGGMGTVWLAQRADQQFEQQVAIKLIKRGMDTEDVLRRFRRERQVLAQLEHPHIARLLDGGATPDGRPYLVMEFIDGVAITDYCEHERLSVTERLRLFIQVCSAVQYAHQNLIVHRDLKPTNILVSSAGSPKLLDFGIAKILRPDEESSPVTTASDLRLLTPRYASPEQVRNERVTTATDTYSLGVILYELLTGAEPYRLTTRSRVEYERAICEQEPLRPSSVATASGPAAAKADAEAHADRRRRKRVLSGDLDTIVLKALRKEPGQRYASVEQLTQDLQRYLDGLPVLARPQTVRYRAAKFIARNKAAAAAALTVVLVLIGASVVSATFAVREARQRALAEQRLREAQTQTGIAAEQRALAEERLGEARTQTAIAEAINKFINEDLLASVDPDRTPDPQVSVRSVLDTASRKIGSRFQDQPLVEASILSTLGMTYESLGEYEAAEPHLDRAYTLLREAAGGRAEQTILAMARLGNIKRWRANLPEAEPLIRGAAELAEETLGPSHLTTLQAMHGLGELYVDLGQAGEAIKVLEKTVELENAVLGESAAETFSSMDTLAVAYSNAGQNEQAERLNLEIVQRRTAAFGPDTLGTISALNNLAYVRMNLGKYEESESIFRDAIERSRRVLGDRHPSTLTSIDNLGLVCTHRGNYAEAEKLHAEAYDKRLATLGPDHWETLTSYANLGFVYTSSGAFAKAEPLFAELVGRLRQVSGADHPFTLTMENNLAYSIMELGRYEEAERRFKDVAERRRRVLGPDHPETIGAFSNTAQTLLYQQRYAEALTIVSGMLERAGQSLPEGHAITGVLYYRQGQGLAGLDQFDAAEVSLSKSLEILTAALGPDHPRVAAVNAAIQKLHEERGSGSRSSVSKAAGLPNDSE